MLYFLTRQKRKHNSLTKGTSCVAFMYILYDLGYLVFLNGTTMCENISKT